VRRLQKTKVLPWSYWTAVHLIAGFGVTGPSAVAQIPTAVSGNIAEGKSSRRSEAGRAIILRVYNYAHVPPIILSEAEQDSAAVFREAGVETRWIVCGLPSAKFAGFPACQQPMTRSDFALAVLDYAMRRNVRIRDEALGLAPECPPHALVCNAYVFYDLVTDWSRHGEISAHRLLAYSIAHEIGHLLLGPDSHSREGIMGAWWTPREFVSMGRGSLFFTPEQRDQIRLAVQARTEHRSPLAAQVVTDMRHH